jgi:hypothetical protein
MIRLASTYILDLDLDFLFIQLDLPLALLDGVHWRLV